jgi:D-threo-aldose 1-dehydrogenase
MNASDTVPLRTVRPVPLTRMGFGGAPLGNLYRPVSEADVQAVLAAAWDAGIRYFDTAPQYGLGLSEQRVGMGLSARDRAALTLSTKIGRLLVDCAPGEVTPEAFVDVPQKRIVFDYSYDGVMRSHAESLERLGVGAVDILLVHDVDVFSHGSQSASDARVRELFERGGFRALHELRAAGLVKAIGAGVNEWQVCERLLEAGDFDCFLLAGRYTLLEQEALESFLPLCVARDVAIILGGPFNSGILATGAVPGARYNYAPASPDVLERVGRIERICADHGVRLPAAALQFPAAHPAVRTVIPGAVSAAEVDANVSLFSEPNPAGLWSDLKAAGLLRHDAPTPGAPTPGA